MKDSFESGPPFGPRTRWGTAPGRRDDLVRVGPGRPCPQCHHDGFCQVKEDGSEVWCMRDPSGAVREFTSSLGPVYVHRLTDEVQPRTTRALVEPTVERAPVPVRHRAYTALLAQRPLDRVDLDALRARGLPEEHVRTNGYCTLSDRGRARDALAIVEAVGETAATGVPGIVRRHRRDEDPARAWPHLRAASGLLIPVRDLEGRVVALKMRRRDPVEKGARFVYVSSAKRTPRIDEPPSLYVDSDGASAEAAVHVPLAALAMRTSSARLILTEGELAADVSTALLGEPVASIPGVGAWRAGVDLALAWGARSVAVALDMDAHTNHHVAQALRCLVRALRAEGFDVAEWRWDARFKGLDDMLAARAAGATHAP